jgi:hypothetical protein
MWIPMSWPMHRLTGRTAYFTMENTAAWSNLIACSTRWPGQRRHRWCGAVFRCWGQRRCWHRGGWEGSSSAELSMSWRPSSWAGPALGTVDAGACWGGQTRRPSWVRERVNGGGGGRPNNWLTFHLLTNGNLVAFDGSYFGRKNLNCSGILASLVFWVVFWNSWFSLVVLWQFSLIIF